MKEEKKEIKKEKEKNRLVLYRFFINLQIDVNKTSNIIAGPGTGQA